MNKTSGKVTKENPTKARTTAAKAQPAKAQSASLQSAKVPAAKPVDENTMSKPVATAPKTVEPKAVPSKAVEPKTVTPTALEKKALEEKVGAVPVADLSDNGMANWVGAFGAVGQAWLEGCTSADSRMIDYISRSMELAEGHFEALLDAKTPTDLVDVQVTHGLIKWNAMLDHYQAMSQLGGQTMIAMTLPWLDVMGKTADKG